MQQVIRFGIIGCGLMGREFASAAARWCHLQNMAVKPEIVGVCDANENALKWFHDHIPSVRIQTTNYKELLECDEIDAVYCAVPHHLHKQMYIDIIESGKHLLGEKPFGIDQQANEEILTVIGNHPNVVVRCSSEFPFFPGALQIADWVKEEKFGTIIEVEAGFYHSSDLNPNKPINWKRIVETNGEYGCMGDLGMHVVHLPFTFGWMPKSVRALLSNIVTERPNHEGRMVPCETWDNAILACDVETGNQSFPMILSMKRIAPGHANTWFIRISGTSFSAEFSTKYPKQVRYLPYDSSGSQAWRVEDVPYKSAFETITGPIFEFGFSDSIIQMWAAFCDELASRDKKEQSFYCATPEMTKLSHQLFTAALRSNKTGETIHLNKTEVVH
ncbi:oxidoreductase [Bacillus sp. FJAT-27225]|uniref:Gfo/Idh/MocA family protein n=1 Tax=Bacillus sp. FJAT-27225 TaxID=1743144 RepID=UPI00080C2FA1|nr:Gfo/Idh/MocA family oxidoreductase [Bacillus sp. FJAT-27225]OCA85966.1 oxidoreductase [Bacillus sp. FJAT-27225]